MKKIIYGIMPVLLLIATSRLAFSFQTTNGGGTIYIRADGSVDPSTALISSVDNITYVFTNDIINCSIVVERDNIVVDGAGYTIHGMGGAGRGIDLSGRSNVTIENMKITEFEYGVYLYSSSNNRIIGNNITINSLPGIFLRSASSNDIIGNSITDNSYGVNLESSLNNSIVGNSITHNLLGIRLNSSSNNSISANSIIANNWRGIFIDSSSNYNGIVGNNITNSEFGIVIYSSFNNRICETNLTANSARGIFLFLSSSNCISRSNVTGSLEGVGLYGCSSNSVSANVIAVSAEHGIMLYDSSGNSLVGNTIRNNAHGMRLNSSSNNVLYHNNFVYNGIQASLNESFFNEWDDGYPSGGNYWSDCAVADLYSGVYQNETGSDGIGDRPYIIGEYDSVEPVVEDRYPIVAPFDAFDVGNWSGERRQIHVVSNSTVSNFRLNEADKIISFNVTGEGGLGFCRVTIPNIIVQDLWQGNYTVLVDNALPLDIREWKDMENTYIYFAYQHSEHEVKIIPEFSLVAVLLLFMTVSGIVLVFAKKKNVLSEGDSFCVFSFG